MKCHTYRSYVLQQCMGRLESRLRRILEVTERIEKGAVHVLHLSGEDTLNGQVRWRRSCLFVFRRACLEGQTKKLSYHHTRVVGSKVITCVFSHLERLVILIGLLGSEDTQDVAEAQSGVQTYFLLTQTAHNEHQMWRCKWVSSFFSPNHNNATIKITCFYI